MTPSSLHTPIFRNSAMDSFLTCPALYYLNYIRHIVPVRRSIALELGISIHTAAAEWYKGIQKAWDSSDWRYTDTQELLPNVINGFITDFTAKGFDYHKQKNVEVGVKLLEDLFDQCRYDPDQIVEVEKTRYKPITNFLYQGTIDLLVKGANNTLLVIDHKTSGKVSANQFIKWKLRRQFAGYCWLTDTRSISVNLLHTVMKPDVRILPFLFSKAHINRWYHQTAVIGQDIIERLNVYNAIEPQHLENSTLPDSLWPRVATKCQILGCTYEPLCYTDELIQNLPLIGGDFMVEEGEQRYE